jgi:hypothetical protein
MVARQFIAWVAQRQNPSRMERCDESPPELTICRRDHISHRNQDSCEYGTSNHSSYRALRDGSLLRQIPGNKLPGYHH